MQLSKQNEGILGTTRNIFQQEGIGGFYKGLPPAILRHWMYTATRIFLYEEIRNNVK